MNPAACRRSLACASLSPATFGISTGAWPLLRTNSTVLPDGTMPDCRCVDHAAVGDLVVEAALDDLRLEAGPLELRGRPFERHALDLRRLHGRRTERGHEGHRLALLERGAGLGLHAQHAPGGDALGVLAVGDAHGEAEVGELVASGVDRQAGDRGHVGTVGDR